MVELLYALSEKYTLFLLSNTNAIHIEEVDWLMGRTFGKNVFKDAFKACFYSYELRSHKPDAQIYRMAHERMGTPSFERFVFFDDSQANVDAANRLGWNAVRIDNGLVDAMPALGLL